MTIATPPPIALSIAGSDSGGGAGIQADLKTFHAHGVFGTTAITAVTAQNTLGVHGVHAIPSKMVLAQIDDVATDLRPRAFKTGMLATADLVRTVRQAIDAHRLTNFVLDPVMVASSGDRLLDQEAERVVFELLVPAAAVATPNLFEAEILVGFPIADEEAMERAAAALVEAGAAAALIKGGHLQGEETVDVLHDGERIHAWRRRRLDTRNNHGTGCTLSAAITANLALELPVVQAVERALDFVHRALITAPDLGEGHGPLNHLLSPHRAA